MKRAQIFVVSLMYSVTLIAQTNGDDSERLIRKSTEQRKMKQQLKTNNMKKILIIGLNPHTIDFKNPELPPGLSAEAIEKGTKETVEKLISIGYDTEVFLVNTGATDLSDLVERLNKKKYDGVVVGNGIRGVKSNFLLFEQIINVVHSQAAKSKIIFNSLPTDTDEAVKRWL